MSTPEERVNKLHRHKSTGIEPYRKFVRSLVQSPYGICPVCSYLWIECDCGVVDPSWLTVTGVETR